jgi:ABC-type dipeptide/oligopeptide/nickel transport system permease component
VVDRVIPDGRACRGAGPLADPRRRFRRRGSVLARGLETAGLIFYCAPPYVVGFLVLLAFDPCFGVLPLRFLIDPNRFGEPFPDASHYVRGMLLPGSSARARWRRHRCGRRSR